MKHKLGALVLTLIVIASLVIIGCAKPAPAPVPAPTPEPSPTPAPAPTPASTPPPEEAPPEEESTMPILTDGTHSWRLKATTFVEQEVELIRGVLEPVEGNVFLQADFKNLSGVDLIKVWYEEMEGGKTSLIEIFSIKGIANVYVTDSQGNMYPAVVLSASKITFGVPYDGHDFTLYFLDYAPIELGY